MAKKKVEPQKLEANPERGERGDFLKISVTLPAEMLNQLQQIGVKRRAAGLKNRVVSELVREAVAKLIEDEGK